MRTHLAALVAVTVASAVGGAHAVGVPGQGDWVTTLQPRDLDGNAANGPEAFYDTALNISWLRNANVNGFQGWISADVWARSLVVGGIGGWRLPTMVDTGTPGQDCSNAGGTDCGYNVQTATSEMAHLWYVALGNLSPCNPATSTVSFCAPQAGSGLTNTGDFQNTQPLRYWTGLPYALGGGNVWFFEFNGGYQGVQALNTGITLSMAVHPGDVGAVPEPQTYGMILMGLSMLLLALRRRSRRGLGD